MPVLADDRPNHADNSHDDGQKQTYNRPYGDERKCLVPPVQRVHIAECELEPRHAGTNQWAKNRCEDAHSQEPTPTGMTLSAEEHHKNCGDNRCNN
jgi:hypothetical protein